MIKLKKGDIVDIIAPASSTEGKELFKAYDKIKKWGLIPRTFIDFTTSHPFHSDDDEMRLQDLVRALYAKDSKIVWCLRGGYGSARLLDELSKLPKPPKQKYVIGYSDITALHSFLNQSWGWETIHGPTISSFSYKGFDQKCFKELKEILFGKTKKASFALKPLNGSAENLRGVISSELVGGNLTVLQTLIGTKFQLKSKNKILMLEDVNERGYRIDRTLVHLEMSGALKGCKAIIFGNFTNGLEPDGNSFVEFALMRFSQNTKIPVFSSHEFGHGRINRALVLKRKYKIKKNILSVNY